VTAALDLESALRNCRAALVAMTEANAAATERADKAEARELEIESAAELRRVLLVDATERAKKAEQRATEAEAAHEYAANEVKRLAQEVEAEKLARTEAAEKDARIAALERFKAYVHKRLDEAGVPANPQPPVHALEGCRVGDRLDYIERWSLNPEGWRQARADLETLLASARRDLSELCGWECEACLGHTENCIKLGKAISHVVRFISQAPRDTAPAAAHPTEASDAK
jgi:hypothetical protein